VLLSGMETKIVTCRVISSTQVLLAQCIVRRLDTSANRVESLQSFNEIFTAPYKFQKIKIYSDLKSPNNTALSSAGLQVLGVA